MLPPGAILDNPVATQATLNVDEVVNAPHAAAEATTAATDGRKKEEKCGACGVPGHCRSDRRLCEMHPNHDPNPPKKQ